MIIIFGLKIDDDYRFFEWAQRTFTTQILFDQWFLKWAQLIIVFIIDIIIMTPWSRTIHSDMQAKCQTVILLIAAATAAVYFLDLAHSICTLYVVHFAWYTHIRCVKRITRINVWRSHAGNQRVLCWRWRRSSYSAHTCKHHYAHIRRTCTLHSIHICIT